MLLLQLQGNFPPSPENGQLVLRVRFKNPGEIYFTRVEYGWSDTATSNDISLRGFVASDGKRAQPRHPKDFHVIGIVDLLPRKSQYTPAPASAFGPTGEPIMTREHWEDDLESVLMDSKSHLDHCQNNHQCRPRTDEFLPTRLVKICRDHGRVTAKIHITQKGESLQYAALSYVWGHVKPVVIDGTTMETWAQQLPVAKLPTTLQDALMVTLNLDLRYLWVDCLCILQDDPEDKAREIAKLPQIFENAYVTISAAGSRSCDEGFLPRIGSRASSLLAPRLTMIDLMNNPEQLFVRPSGREFDQDNQPIHKRAWTLQEHALSPRTLIFGTGHVKFVCREGSKVISGKDYLRAIRVHLSLPTMNKIHSPRERWYDTVKDYTRRILSDPNDRLPAISGLAQKFSIILEDIYLAGLWKNSLLADLHWFVFDHGSDLVDSAVNRLPGPTWSWATSRSEILFPSDGEINTEASYFATVIDCTVKPAIADLPFGLIISGRLKLKGHFFKACFRSANTSGVSRSYQGKLSGNAGEFGGSITLYPDGNNNAFQNGKDGLVEITCLELSERRFSPWAANRGPMIGFEVWGLLLCKAEAGFQRSGLWTYWYSSKLNWSGERAQMLHLEWKECIRNLREKVVTIT
ncbi:uncharacterized protein A1O5_10959 [Cladophialophora psammophila CBS 110553]|uniref:Heterokaryon incompatibility domain-containing protein n=1 Tax=Cladophialophora psammophila CBS 110553 TaxID=1182543 RepID=W9WCZ0_9EURO|nr:uncharacterized protein A1O5_10959 [Cladophialophora psammophila CBS 110553]EXJ65982.1 hypothetical protein A1O5_10959 [Cladophialophora psammophila CBS 110553]